MGFGDPVMDFLVPVNHEYLVKHDVQPGGCVPISPEELQATLQNVGQTTSLARTTGGSAANVMKGLSKISNGQLRCSFLGMAGLDETAEEYREQMMAYGVRPLLLESPSSAPTATCVCFLTPDGQRTMRTCLGASLELTTPSQLPPGCLEAAAQLLHCEGYSLYRPQLTRHLMAAAKAAGGIVSLDLASFEVVQRCGEMLLQLLREGLVDVVFGNRQECIAVGQLLGVTDSGSEDVMVAEVQRRLLQWCKVAVVSLGSEGCIARGADGQVGRAPACLVPVTDTLAAGDYFSSGFLYGYMQGMSLEACAKCGCAAGAEAVQARGADVQEASWARLRDNLRRLQEHTPKARFSPNRRPGHRKKAAAISAVRQPVSA